MRLLATDIARDGGSLAAFFKKRDGEILSLWLQVGPWDEPLAARWYRELLVSNQMDPENGHLIRRGSIEETELFADLDRFLSATLYSSEWSQTLQIHGVEFVLALRTAAEGRRA